MKYYFAILFLFGTLIIHAQTKQQWAIWQGMDVPDEYDTSFYKKDFKDKYDNAFKQAEKDAEKWWK